MAKIIEPLESTIHRSSPHSALHSRAEFWNPLGVDRITIPDAISKAKLKIITDRESPAVVQIRHVSDSERGLYNIAEIYPTRGKI